MINRNCLVPAVTFILGITCGYLLKPTPTPPSLLSKSDNITQYSQTTSSSSKLNPTLINKKEELKNPFDKAEPASSKQVSTESRIDESNLPAADNISLQYDTPASASELISELTLVSNWHDLEAIGIEGMAESEVEFLQSIEQSPNLVKPLIAAYSEMPEDSVKELLRSMLTASGALEVEQSALAAIAISSSEDRPQWLKLLASTGVNSPSSRNTLLTAMDSMTDPSQLKTSLYAFSPDTVSRDEKIQIASRLEYYTSHDDENVRGAGVEALSKWVEKDNSYFIEKALADESEIVRRSAIFSSYSAGIQSESIKSQLFNILGDSEQPYELRLDVFNSLSNYKLEGEEYQYFLKFNEEVIHPQATAGNAKG